MTKEGDVLLDKGPYKTIQLNPNNPKHPLANQKGSDGKPDTRNLEQILNDMHCDGWKFVNEWRNNIVFERISKSE